MHTKIFSFFLLQSLDVSVIFHPSASNRDKFDFMHYFKHLKLKQISSENKVIGFALNTREMIKCIKLGDPKPRKKSMSTQTESDHCYRPPSPSVFSDEFRLLKK